MMTANEAELREAMRLLDEINDNPLHPVNDKRHPGHEACLKAYQELEVWVMKQQGGIVKL